LKSDNNIDLKLTLLVIIALFSLSTNPVLCRMAMISGKTDPVSFTILRILSGAVFLFLLNYFKHKNFALNPKTSWLSAFMLFLYAITFSYSYVDMPAGIGTLILFAVVQLSMILMALFYKEKLTLRKTIGMILAFCGLVYLLYPKEDFSLSFYHSFLMIISGIAWAFYTILGKKSKDAFLNTKDNFLKASVFTIIFALIFVQNITFDSYTLFLAIFSGVVTSALGYIIWYAVLPKMQILTAGIIQLFAPVISIIIGMIFLNESFTITLFLSTSTIILGIFIAIFSNKKSKN
jgi:drug/metabolite transporter (DMT)-like permease